MTSRRAIDLALAAAIGCDLASITEGGAWSLVWLVLVVLLGRRLLQRLGEVES